MPNLPTQLNKNNYHTIDVHAFPSASNVSMTQFLHSNKVQKLPRTQHKAERSHKLFRTRLVDCNKYCNVIDILIA